MSAGYGYGSNDNPGIIETECDGCGRTAPCVLGYACPATCNGACGTDGCEAVLALCQTCAPRLYESGRRAP